MLAEAKRKKAAPADDEVDFDMDSGDLDLGDEAPAAEPKKTKSAGDKKGAPAGLKAKGDDEVVVDKAAVLKFLKGATPEERSSICTRLQKMVAADEAAAEK
jgi:hypothetical protein